MAQLLVVGGSGAVGGFLLQRLQQAGHDLTALSRRPQAPRPGLRWIIGGLDAALVPPPCEAIVCAGPLDQFVAWLERSRPAGLSRVIALSSMSADSKRESADPAERALAARLADAERRLADCCTAAGVHWLVLRPTLIYGTGLDLSLSPIARRARRLRLFPLLPGACGLRQPVHADDVAAACVAALDRGEQRVYALGGGERLSYAAMLQRLRESLDRATLPLPLPLNLLRLATRLSGRGGAMVQRLTQDLVADNRAVEAALGLCPRPFRPGPECWGAPASPPAPQP